VLQYAECGVHVAGCSGGREYECKQNIDIGVEKEREHGNFWANACDIRFSSYGVNDRFGISIDGDGATV
jgi:hypothetical protein